MVQRCRCNRQRRGVPVIGDGWNPQVGLLTPRSTSNPAVGSKKSNQRGEAGCGDVARCDDLLSGPTTGKHHDEAGCGDVSRCDDPPPFPMHASQNGVAGCGDVPQCDDPLPTPFF